MNRRDYFKKSYEILSLGFVGLCILRPLKVFAAAKKYDFVDPTDAVAKSLKYVKEAPKAEVAKSQINCSNCQHFTKKAVVDGDDVGTCVIFQDKFVYAKSHCIAWSKKS